jgi:hypothetical protein
VFGDIEEVGFLDEPGIPVGLIKLLSEDKRLNNKHVITSGILSIEVGIPFKLFVNESDFEMYAVTGNFDNALLIAFDMKWFRSEGINLYDYNHAYVDIYGVYVVPDRNQLRSFGLMDLMPHLKDVSYFVVKKPGLGKNEEVEDIGE